MWRGSSACVNPRPQATSSRWHACRALPSQARDHRHQLVHQHTPQQRSAPHPEQPPPPPRACHPKHHQVQPQPPMPHPPKALPPTPLPPAPLPLAPAQSAAAHCSSGGMGRPRPPAPPLASQLGPAGCIHHARGRGSGLDAAVVGCRLLWPPATPPGVLGNARRLRMPVGS